jgi:formate hydrogenlyase subunit 6/NADH:ubiquinone oxidoreductase subunit I
MNLATMLGDVLRSLVRKPVTQRYPFEKTEAPDNLRGRLVWDATKCTGCMLCVKDCPSKAIEIITVDKVNKRFVMRYHLDRCTFCAQCVETCRFSCLNMSHDQWEEAALKKEPFTIYYGRDEDVDIVLGKAELPKSVPQAPASDAPKA